MSLTLSWKRIVPIALAFALASPALAQERGELRRAAGESTRRKARGAERSEPRATEGDLGRGRAASPRDGDGALVRGVVGELKSRSEQARGRSLGVLERGRLGLLVRIFKSDAFQRSEIDTVLKDAEKVIESTGIEGRSAERRAWVPLVAARSMRRVVIRAILRDINARSEKVKGLIRERGDAAVWDTVFIGAGVHTAAATNALSKADPSHRALVIEAGNVVSSNFASLGETIAINSSSRREDGKGVQPFGKGNNNPAEGPVGVPDISGEKWPAADTLSDVATISLHASGADVITGSKVSKVTEVGAKGPARYKIETADGLTVFAASVVVGSGLGKPELISSDPRTTSLVQRETAKVDYKNPDKVPGIVYYEQAMALANQSAAPRDAYRAAKPGGRAPKVAVIGGGDSGKTFLELLYGLAPSGAYSGPGKRDATQRGEVGDLDWVVGPDGPKDCKGYLDTTRARYARISPQIKKGESKLVNARLDTVEKIPSGKDRGKFRISYSDGSSAVYDRIVIATGFKSEAPEFLAGVLPEGYDRTVEFTKSDALARVPAKVGSGRSATRDVAKRVVGQDVFLIGPAAGNDLVKRDQILVDQDRSQVDSAKSASSKAAGGGEQIAISENLASIKFLVPYSAALAREVLPRSKVEGKTLDTSPADEKLRRSLVLVRGGRANRVRIRRAKVADAEDPASDPQRTGLEPLVLKHEMATVLDEFAFAGGGSEVSITIRPAPGGLLVESRELDKASLDKVRQGIEANFWLVNSLQKYAAVRKPVTFRADLGGKAGQPQAIDVASLSFTY